MAGTKGSSAGQDSEDAERDVGADVDLDAELGVDLGFDLLGWRGLALAGTAITSLVLLAEVTHNALATILGTFLVVGIALDLLLRPTRVVLGKEGLVRSGIRTSRMRYADIARVVHGVERQQLTIHGAAAMWVFVARSSRARDAELAELARSLEERLAAFRGQASEPRESAPLTRGDRDDATWTRELRDLVAGERHGYREATVSPEVLLRIAENPTSREVERVAALVALSPLRAGDPAVRARVAALAPETAALAPELREAIDAWLEDDDEVLEGALHRFE